jgi:hypothetical protein
MATIVDTNANATPTPAPAPAAGTMGDALQRYRPIGATAAVALLVVIAIVNAASLSAAAVAVWNWLTGDGSAARLRWLLALLPGAIILNQVVYIASSRRKQFREALGPLAEDQLRRLEGLYFGYGSLTIRYMVPAIMVTILCSTAIAALTNPELYLKWLYVPLTAAADAVNPAVPSTGLSDVASQWPDGWARQALRGAALGFLGAYVYMLLLLTDRARQRDVTTGIATWAAAMPVLGPMMGGVAALLLASATTSTEGSFTQDAVFFVVGMLPRQFATFVQSGVRKMFQTGTTTPLRTLPLTMVRGIGPDVEARLEEEGIYDVSALAYASPHQLIRSTMYAPKQIADWIDEALLIATVPAHWDALEKVGVTGAMDLAWYTTSPGSIPALATEIKMPEPLLKDVVARLSQDAQVLDLYKLYWDHSAAKPPLTGEDTRPVNPATGALAGDSLPYTFRAGIEQDARDRLLTETKSISGVRATSVNGDDLTFVVDPAQRETIVALLDAKKEIERRDG